MGYRESLLYFEHEQLSFHIYKELTNEYYQMEICYQCQSYIDILLMDGMAIELINALGKVSTGEVQLDPIYDDLNGLDEQSYKSRKRKILKQDILKVEKDLNSLRDELEKLSSDKPGRGIK